VSIGVANGQARDWHSVLRAADKGLYSAKRGGRNQVKAARAPAPVRSTSRGLAGGNQAGPEPVDNAGAQFQTEQDVVTEK